MKIKDKKRNDSKKNKSFYHLNAFIVLVCVFWLLLTKKSLEAVDIKSSYVIYPFLSLSKTLNIKMYVPGK